MPLTSAEVGGVSSLWHRLSEDRSGHWREAWKVNRQCALGVRLDGWCDSQFHDEVGVQIGQSVNNMDYWCAAHNRMFGPREGGSVLVGEDMDDLARELLIGSGDVRQTPRPGDGRHRSSGDGDDGDGPGGSLHRAASGDFLHTLTIGGACARRRRPAESACANCATRARIARDPRLIGSEGQFRRVIVER